MIHCGKITKEQLLTIERAGRRQNDIDNNMNFSRHRIVQSKKHKAVKHKSKLFNE